MIENEILIINFADFSFIYIFIIPEIYIRVPWAQILALNRISTSGSLYNRVGLGYLQYKYNTCTVVTSPVYIGSKKKVKMTHDC